MIDRSSDINDGKEWSEMDIADLKNHVAQGASLAETSDYMAARRPQAQAKAHMAL